MKDSFEVAIIGGGIIGAGIAFECATRGLSTVLFEKSDFCSETSASSFKIIHGGLRYLQHLDIGRLKESAEEQYLLRKNAPHLVKPLPFLVPCYGRGMKSRSALNLACSVYEFLTKTRNRNLPQELQLPDHQILQSDEVLKLAPHLSRQGLRGGVVFYDVQMKNDSRLSLSVVKSAERAGAEVRNYHEVVQINSHTDSGKKEIKSLEVRDALHGRVETIQAKYVINAMGPWGERLNQLFPEYKKKSDTKKVFYSKGIQLVLPQVIEKYAVSVESRGLDTAAALRRGGRSFFMQPWNGKTLLGTTDTIYAGNPDDFSIEREEVTAFLKEVHDVYPSPLLNINQVSHVFGGLRAISAVVYQALERGEDRDGLVNTTRDEILIDHAKECACDLPDKVENLLSIIGVKYTTFRKVAEEVVELLERKGCRTLPLSTRDVALFGSPDPLKMGDFYHSFNKRFSKISELLGETSFNDVLELYGLEAESIFEGMDKVAGSVDASVQDVLLESRLRHAVEHDYARTLDDVLFRRLTDFSGVFPGEDYLMKVSKKFFNILDINAVDAEEQLSKVRSRVEKFYYKNL